MKSRLHNPSLGLKRFAKIGIIIAGTLGILFGSWSCASKNVIPKESITLATLPLETSTLIFIADNQGFFYQNSINIQFKYYDTGLGTLNALLNGEADLAVPVGEYAMLGKIFGGALITTIGAIDKSDVQILLGRKDHGIEKVADLRGKSVGLIKGTQEEFYFVRFLQLNGINLSDTTIVNIPLSQSADAIVKGDVDAEVMYPLYMDTAIESLGNYAVTWPVQASQPTQQLLICQTEWITQHADLTKRFLESLSKA
jgi:ABC-type nitrate/sulfonate/bicarbonate transport system substrate-binding protein